MQTATSQYGRKGIRVSDACPTRAIRRRMGSVHITAPDHYIEEMVRKGVKDSKDARWTPKLINEAVRYALWIHHENGAEYGAVMGASL